MQNQGPITWPTIIGIFLGWVVIPALYKPTQIYLENHTRQNLTLTLTYFERDISKSFSNWEFWEGSWKETTRVVLAGDATIIGTVRGVGNRTIKVSAAVGFLGRRYTPPMTKVFDPRWGFFENSHLIEILSSDLPIEYVPVLKPSPSLEEPTPFDTLPPINSDPFKRLGKELPKSNF